MALETYPVGVPFKVPNRRGLYMRLVPGASSDPNWMPVRALHRGSLTGLAAPTGVRPATDDEVHQELGDPAWLDLVDAGSFDPGRFSRERRTQRDRLAALTHAVMTELLGWEPVEELGKGVCRDALGQFYRNGYTGETSPRSTGDAGKVRIFTPFTDHSNAWVLMHAMTGPGGVLHRVYPSGSPCSGYDVFQEWWRTSDLWALDLPRVANLLTVTLLALAGMKAAELDEMRDGLEQQSMPVWRPSRRVDL